MAYTDLPNGSTISGGILTIPVGNVAIPAGNLKLRVKALNGNNAGAVLTNSVAFTIAGGGTLPKQIKATGNSNTATTYNPSTSHVSNTLRTGWVEQTPLLLDASFVIDENKAVPGYTASNTLAQTAAIIAAKDTVNFSQTIVLLQIGVNDISWEDWRPSMHQIAAYIFEFGNQMRKAGIKPVLVTPPCHRNYYPADPAKDAIVIARWNLLADILKSNYLDYGFVGLVDLTTNAFIGQSSSVVDYPEYWLDSIHWNTDGQELVAADVAPVIQAVAAMTMPAYTELPPYTEPAPVTTNNVVWQDESNAKPGGGVDFPGENPNTLVGTGGLGGARSTVTIGANGVANVRGWFEFEIGVNPQDTWTGLKYIHGNYTYSNFVLAWQNNPAGTSALPTAGGNALPGAVAITTVPGDIARVEVHQAKAVFLINGVSVYELPGTFNAAYFLSCTLQAAGDKVRDAKIFAATPEVTPPL